LQVGYLPKLKSVGGVRCIPFMQVILMLSTDLDGGDERDRGSLDSLLSALIGQLDMHDVKEDAAERSSAHEMQLVILRHVSILMSRCRF
jgi:E3 ubiquitin-protein ligase UBR4